MATRKTPAKRTVNPRRQTKLHNDGSIPNAVEQIEKVFDLPAGSVKLTYPSGRKAHANSNVGKIRDAWKK